MYHSLFAWGHASNIRLFRSGVRNRLSSLTQSDAPPDEVEPSQIGAPTSGAGGGTATCFSCYDADVTTQRPQWESGSFAHYLMVGEKEAASAGPGVVHSRWQPAQLKNAPCEILIKSSNGRTGDRSATEEKAASLQIATECLEFHSNYRISADAVRFFTAEATAFRS